jgi:hypothetical protein
MAAEVTLEDIADELSISSEQMRSYVDRETGEVVSVMVEDLSAAEECDDP